MSKSAWHVGECAMGERATKILLETHPRVPQFHTNMAAYLGCDKRPTDLWGYMKSDAELRQIEES
jgi:hypothetical protein